MIGMHGLLVHPHEVCFRKKQVRGCLALQFLMGFEMICFMKLPIGVQHFPKLREKGYLYVDKTELIYRLLKEGEGDFLSRPRRFGKSLLVSVLNSKR